MRLDFAKDCHGCKYSDTEIDVINVGEDSYVSDGYKTCAHPNNEDEYWIPFLRNCPWKVVE